MNNLVTKSVSLSLLYIHTEHPVPTTSQLNYTKPIPMTPPFRRSLQKCSMTCLPKDTTSLP